MKHTCNCGTTFEYDDWDFGTDVVCPNPDCKQKYYLACDDGSEEGEHIHYLEKE